MLRFQRYMKLLQNSVVFKYRLEYMFCEASKTNTLYHDVYII